MTRMNCCCLKLRLDNDGRSAQGDERNRALRREHFQARPHDSVAPLFDCVGLQVGQRQGNRLAQPGPDRSCAETLQGLSAGPIGPRLRKAVALALADLKTDAIEQGGNGVVGARLEVLPTQGSVAFVTLSGTAVIIES